MANDSLTAALTGHTNQRDTVTTPQTVTLTLSGNTTGDSVIVLVDSDDTAPIAYNAPAADVAAAVNALESVDPEAPVTATGGPLNTAPVVLTVPELEDVAGVPEWTIDDSDLTGTGTITVTGGNIQATHLSDVVLDPNSQDAVQTPIAQQTGGLNRQGVSDPATVLGDN